VAVSFAFGAAFYMTLGKAWLAAIGKTREELGGGASPFVIEFVGQVVIAYLLSVLMVSLGTVSLGGGLTIGLSVWIAFVVTTMTINHRYQGASRALTMIDGAHWLGVFAIQGIVIGLIAG
jgi:hypothetical protein